MYMHNIYLLIYCLVLFPLYIAADDNTDEFCSDYFKENVDWKKDGVKLQYPSGLLWSVRKNGLQSYLFGTLHSQDLRVTRVPPVIRLSIAQSNIVMLEVVPDNKSNEVFLEYIYADPPYHLEKLLDPSIYQQVQQSIPDYHIEVDRLDQMKPWAVFTIIGRPRPVQAPTLEGVIMNLALSSGKQITGIQTMQELLDTLDTISMDDQIEILNDTVCNLDKIISDTARLVSLYLVSDLQGIHDFKFRPHHDEAVFNRFIEKILYERNAIMLDRIMPYLQTENIFIAVGAMHLVGETGLLQNLKRQGYQLEKIY